MLCFVTVDTEEDDWGDYQCREGTVENIELLPGFQRLCDDFGAIPTYLTNWPVAHTPRSRDILRELHAAGRCEIGTHCHPWNTPPVDEVTGPQTSWMRNLPAPLVASKLRNLHRLLQESFGVTPTVFRTGRWGFGPGVAAALADLGYLIDSSVSPRIDWSPDGGPDYSAAPLRLHRFDPADPDRPVTRGRLLQIPATVGFFQPDQDAAGNRNRQLRQHSPRVLRLVGLADRLGLLNLRWLSPETTSAAEMIRLATALRNRGYSWLNVPLHSVTLLPGRTPFIRTTEDQARFLDTIREFLTWARSAGITFAPLSAGASLLPPDAPATERI